MAPGMAVYVHDAYVDGEGILNPAILGLFPLAGEIDADDLAQGEFVRFFAESAWYPTALLPSQGVHWEAVNDHSATATLADGKVSVTMFVSFNDAGLIESARVAARAVLVGNAVVPTPWEGRMSNYHERDGMLVPLTAEASWLHLDGRKPYWRGTITSITYEFAISSPSMKELPGVLCHPNRDQDCAYSRIESKRQLLYAWQTLNRKALTAVQGRIESVATGSKWPISVRGVAAKP